MRLSRDTDHSFPSDPPSDEWMECERCGLRLPPNEEPRSHCSGLNQRSGGLQRSGGSLKRTPLSPVSDSNSGGAPTHTDLADWIRWQPCLLSGYEPADGCSGDVICHHVRSRGAGYGDWRVTTDGRVVGNVTPLCTHHHRELHDRGRDTFERRYSLDLEHVARRYGEMDDAPEPPQRVRDRAQIREREDG